MVVTAERLMLPYLLSRIGRRFIEQSIQLVSESFCIAGAIALMHQNHLHRHVDDQQGRDGSHAEHRHHFTVQIEEYRIVDAEGSRKGANLRCVSRTVDADAYKTHPTGFVLVREIHEYGDRLDARSAPGGPEVDDGKGIARDIAELNRPTLCIIEPKVRYRLRSRRVARKEADENNHAPASQKSATAHSRDCPDPQSVFREHHIRATPSFAISTGTGSRQPPTESSRNRNVCKNGPRRR